MRHAWDTAVGLLLLGRLAWRTRFRFDGPYWRWRLETAFGPEEARPPRGEMRRGTLDYARWLARMHRLRRAR